MSRNHSLSLANICCLAFIAVVLSIVVNSHVFAQVEPLPKEIVGLNMGSSSEDLLKKISGSGSHSSEKLGQEDRTKITWSLPENPYYSDLAFHFTEKNRLFLIRFNLKPAEKEQIQALKKSFFDSQKFLWEDPMRMRVKDNDLFLYIKESGPECFFDFVNRKTGERGFELFNRAISVEDRPLKETKPNEEQKTTPADVVRESILQETGQKIEPALPAEPTDAQKSPEVQESKPRAQ